jgi:hypothetical protein
MRDQCVIVALGEGNRPPGIIADKHFEEYAFPCIHGREKIPTNRALSNNMLCRCQLRNYDRRAAANSAFIFLKLRKVRAEVISRTAWLRLRKSKKDGRALTARMLLNPGQRAEIVKSEVGFTDLKALRGSPHYHDGNKRDVFAMLRQMGPPTFFLTNFMADTRWAELLQALVWQAHRKNLSQEEVLALPWVEQALLVRNDPVACAR